MGSHSGPSWPAPGESPLPGDPVLLDALKRLVPEHRDLAGAAHAWRSCRSKTATGLGASGQTRVRGPEREVTGGQSSPRRFSLEQWRQTLRRGYQWLRIGGYLGACLELDEVRGSAGRPAEVRRHSAAGETPRGASVNVMAW